MSQPPPPNEAATSAPLPPPTLPHPGSDLGRKIGVLAFSIVATIIVPMIPLFIEGRRHGHIQNESYLLTAAVLAAGFAFTSDGNLFRAAYALLFIYSIVENFPVERGDPNGEGSSLPAAGLDNSSHLPGFLATGWGWISANPALTSLLTVALIHAIERFRWHIMLSRRFPDWLKD